MWRRVLSKSAGLGFGGFLVALGLGWYYFSTVDVSLQLFAYILVIGGIGIIANSLLAWRWSRLRIQGLVSGIIGGLILSLILTSGTTLIDYFTGFDVGTFRAEGTEAFEGALTAPSVYLEIDNFNGPIRVRTHSAASFDVTINIIAKGTSQQQADERRDDFIEKIRFTENIVQNQHRLIVNYNLASNLYSRYSVEVVVTLPAVVLLEADLASSNGGISISSITGTMLQLDTSNGALNLNEVIADRITGQTSNGGINGEIMANQTHLSSSNGGLTLRLEPPRSGEYILSTSNGPVRITLSSASNIGYDLDLSTSNGDIDIALPDLEYSENQRTSKKAATVGFESKDIQVSLEIDTSNGNIDIVTP
jgi:hypothetical protein